MKNKILFFALILFVAGCSSGTDETEEVVEEEVIDTPAISDVDEPGITVTNKPSLWTVEYEDQSNSEKLKKPEDIGINSLSVADLITALNENFTDIQLKLNKISHDTIFVTIPESDVLTQQMGSTGAYNYMATTVFNLTELDDIKYVKFDFNEGDHSSPGVFSREDFKVLR